MNPVPLRFIGFLLAAFGAMAIHAQSGNVEWRTTIKDDSIRVQELVRKEVVISRRYYVGDRPVGIWQQFDKKGKLLVERDFSKLRYGAISQEPKQDAKGDTTSMTVMQEMPEFPGGEAALFQYLGTNTKYPSEAVEEGISGLVLVTGVVDRTGKWTTESIVKGAHPLLDHEAWRVLDGMPNWTPGKVDGEPVKARYNIPVRFTLR